MSPEEMTDFLKAMQANAAKVPAAMVSGAREVTRKVKAPGVQVAAGPTGTGVRVRVVSANPRLSSRQAAARLRPVVVKAVDASIKGALRA